MNTKVLKIQTKSPQVNTISLSNVSYYFLYLDRRSHAHDVEEQYFELRTKPASTATNTGKSFLS
jgi:hypothetical protein